MMPVAVEPQFFVLVNTGVYTSFTWLCVVSPAGKMWVISLGGGVSAAVNAACQPCLVKFKGCDVKPETDIHVC